MIQGRMEAGDPAADGRGQGQPPVVDLPFREECTDALKRHATNIWVVGVIVNKVIPDQRTPPPGLTKAHILSANFF